ncbi:MAG: rRNA maturation RNase YbeY [Firmicutes bacterium]|nr:rRNA maturation RNase YbeY [Bacillota bacterium]
MTATKSGQNHIEVFVANEQSEESLDEGTWAELLKNALNHQGIKGAAEISLIFVDETTIASLNERFLKHHGPTDVLSFPIEDNDVFVGRNPDGSSKGPTPGQLSQEMPLLLGDIVICPQVAAANAPGHRSEIHDGSTQDELALLVVHGALHILGMDHENESEAVIMEAKEQEILAKYYRT